MKRFWAVLAVAAATWLGHAGDSGAQEAAEGVPAPSVQTAAVPETQPAPRVIRPAPRTRPAPAASPAPAQGLDPARVEAFVDGFVRSAMARDHIAGVTVAVVQNGQVVLKKGYGFASLKRRTPVDPERTLFRLGPVSTTFTWIALMKEVEAGRIYLDRPVNLYLPEKVQVRDQGYDAPVRVRDLMDHSAGFEERVLGHLYERDYNRVRPLEVYLRQERPRRVREPGAVASYSNFGAGLAGEAVSYTSGKAFERVVEEEILAPLGLRRTTFREPHDPRRGRPAPQPPALTAEIADGYRWTAAGFRERPYEYLGQIAPAGGASSTAADMARYMLMLLGGGGLDGVTIYGPKTAEAFRTPMRRAPQGVNGWAHGFTIYQLPGGGRGFGQDGATLSFNSSLVTAPALGLGLFISTNTDTGEALAKAFPQAFVRQFYGQPTVFPLPGSKALAHTKEFNGYYVPTRRAYRGLEGFIDQLTSGVRVRATPQGYLLTDNGGEVRTWAVAGDVHAGRFLAATGEEPLVFRTQDGRPTAFQLAAGSALFERATPWRQPGVLGLLAGLTATAAAITLIDVALRNRREFRQNAIQGRASLVQNIQAALWLIAMGLFALWRSKTGDVAQVMYGWPGALLVTASASALVAAALTVLTAAAIPAIWRGGRRVDSWKPHRRLFFTVTVLIYLGFSILLGMWGALTPWSG